MDPDRQECLRRTIVVGCGSQNCLHHTIFALLPLDQLAFPK
jgi:hypothetical protein